MEINEFVAVEEKNIGVSADFAMPNIAGLTSMINSVGGTYNAGYSNENGYISSFSDIRNGYSYLNNTSAFSSENFNVSGYTNGNTSVQTQTFSSVNSTSSYTASTFFDVGNKNGYLDNYNANTGVMNFVNADIRSWSRSSDYVNFDMGNGTSFQAQSSSSTDDIFQYSTDGRNVYYAKIGMTDRNNSFTYTDGVTFIGSSDHEDTLNLSTYNKNVDLNGNQYINIDNIDARNSSINYYQRQLIGNAGNNKIYAGRGDLLWGGSGSTGNDDLYGGSGDNTFYYGVGEGNDVIHQSVSTDKVDLYNVSLTDISSYGFDGSSLRFNMAGGESLVIEGSDGASNFVLADRSEYSYNRSTDTWSVKA